jgi:hypothetical protein
MSLPPERPLALIVMRDPPPFSWYNKSPYPSTALSYSPSSSSSVTVSLHPTCAHPVISGPCPYPNASRLPLPPSCIPSPSFSHPPLRPDITIILFAFQLQLLPLCAHTTATVLSTTTCVWPRPCNCVVSHNDLIQIVPPYQN